ncbi:MAG: hypothetical protein WAT74_13465 [Flavobacteriales bacterium]
MSVERWEILSERERGVLFAILSAISMAAPEDAAIRGSHRMDANDARRIADVAEIVVPILGELRGVEFPAELALSAMNVAEVCREVIQREEPK